MFRTFAALVIAGIAAAAAGPSFADTELQLWHYQTTNNRTALRKQLDQFETLNPGVKVKDVFRDLKTIHADIQAAVAAGRGPDVAQVVGRSLVYVIENLQPSAIDAREPWLANFAPNLARIGEYKGKIYAMPQSLGTPILYYNKDLFRRAGLDPEAPPRTWSELRQAARALTAKTGKPGVYVMTFGRDYGPQALIVANGGRMLSEDGSKALFDSAEGIEALQLWQDLVVKDKTHPIVNNDQGEAAFEAGEIAMFVDSSGGLGAHSKAAAGKFQLGTAPFPTFGEKPRRVPNSGSLLVVLTKDSARYAATMKLLGFLADRKQTNFWNRETGYMPVDKDPLGDPEMAAYVKEHPLLRPVIAQIPETVATVSWPGKRGNEIQILIGNLVDDLWAGKGAAAELVPATVKKVNEILGDKSGS